MKKALVSLLIVFLPILASAQVATSVQSPSLVFTNVTVIDMTGAKPKSGVSVVITGNRIAAIGKFNKIKIPSNAQIIDASGKYLIPGLWDMHAHALGVNDNRSEWVFPLLIANGVTGVREIGTTLPFERINQFRREILEGKVLGPRIGATTARILDGKGSILNQQIEVETADEARRLVREYKQQGMDFVKPYNFLSREVYLATVDEAKRQKIAVVGHVPFSMTAAEVSDLGQMIEHNTDIFLSCSRDEEKLRQLRRERQDANRRQREAAKIPLGIPTGPGEVEMKAVETYDEQKATALFKRLAQNRTWMCPTIILSGTTPAERSSRRENDSRVKYVPAPMRERWLNAVKTSAVLPAEYIKMRDQRKLEIVRLMNRTGVRLLAGTDFMNIYLYPGFSLHDEMELFVQAGLSPTEALQTATINPAKFLGREKELGTIEKGKLADLVLLDANPLEDIKNTTKIEAVVANGRYLSKEDLQKLLDNVEKMNNPRVELINKQSSLLDFLNPALTMPAHVCD